MNNWLDIILDSLVIAEIIAAIVASYFCYNRPSKSLYGLTSYLWIVVIIEISGYFERTTGSGNSIWLYNILSIIEIAIFQLLFYTSVNSSKRKLTILLFSLLSLIILISETVVITSEGMSIITHYLNYGFGISSLLLSISALIYITELATTDKILHLTKDLLFWVSIGIIVFHTCNLPFTVLTNVLQKMTHSANALLLIQTFTGIIMYGCFIAGLIYSHKNSNNLKR